MLVVNAVFALRVAPASNTGDAMRCESSIIDPLADDFRPLSDLLNRLPVRPSPPVVCRWHLRDGLRVLKIAGRLYTTEREFRRFLATKQTRPTPKTDADHDAIERQLIERGYAGGDRPVSC